MNAIKKSLKKSTKRAPATPPAVASPDHFLLVPLSDLVLSGRYNVRQQGGDEVEELAALIEAQGLLQALLVVDAADDDANPETGDSGARYAVIAGGRRWRALKLLAARGRIGHDAMIECKLKDVANAVEVSLAENSGREAMHPADEYAAFKRMADAGHGIETIAARFGIPALTVQRRLRLANVSPNLMATFRAGEITLEQLMALAMSDDPALQESVWNHANAWERDPRSLRRLLTRNEVDASQHPLARFVGVADYAAAGGVVRRDLFSQDGQGAYLADVPLLRKLARDKLQAHADMLQAEGWSWVEVRESLTYADRASYGTVSAVPRAMTPDEEATMAALQAHAETVDAQFDACTGDEEDEEAVALQQARDAIEAQIDTLDASLYDWTEDAKAMAGAIVTLDHQGRLHILRGLVAPGAAPAVAASGAAQETEEGNKASRVPPAFSESLMRKLSAHRTAALQAELLAKPDLALLALTEALVASTFRRYGTTAVQVRSTVCRAVLTSQASDVAASPAWLAVETQWAVWEAKLPERDALFPWLQALPTEERTALLAFCAAVALDATFTKPEVQPAGALAAALGCDMANWWQATAASYFVHVAKEKIIDAVAEACGSEATRGMDKMKKEELMRAAELRLASTRWLPVPLRALSV